jgi:serine/threonine-protein kinase
MGSLDAPVAPERLGRYRLLGELGAGGMGTVYLARVEVRDAAARAAAVKTVHPHLAADPRFQRMFRDELTVASRIQHPNVCGVLDWGRIDGRWVLVMELLIGVSLAEVLRRLADGEVPVAERAALAAFVGAELAEGLHAAHELVDAGGRSLGVVHRDVSPSNVVLCFDGTVRLIDFGVASAVDRLQRTETGELKGKLAYAAPEQIRGDRVDRRADVWALGAVLFETVAGRRLRRGTEIASFARASVPALRDCAPEAPLWLDEALARALAPASRRHPTARALGRELRHGLVEDGRVFDAPELAALLDRVFPGEAERQRVLAAAAADPAEDTEVAPTPSRPRRSGSELGRTVALSVLIFLLALAVTAWLLR